MVKYLGYSPANDKGYVNIDISYVNDYNGHCGDSVAVVSLKENTFNTYFRECAFGDVIDLDVRCKVREGKSLSYWLQSPRL